MGLGSMIFDSLFPIFYILAWFARTRDYHH